HVCRTARIAQTAGDNIRGGRLSRRGWARHPRNRTTHLDDASVLRVAMPCPLWVGSGHRGRGPPSGQATSISSSSTPPSPTIEIVVSITVHEANVCLIDRLKNSLNIQNAESLTCEP